VLNLSFFIAAFSSIFWLIYAVRLTGLQTLLANADNLVGLLYAVLITLIPVLVIWTIFALSRSFYVTQKSNRLFYNILDQLRKNSEMTDTLAQSLLTIRQESQNTLLWEEFNTLIADTNEILSDIIKRSNSVSSAQLEHLWERTSGGERWLLAKTFIEISDFQSGFTEHLRQKATKDKLLRGCILEFGAHYKNLHALLAAFDKQQIFYKMIEYGALGKVHHILATIAQDLSMERAAAPVRPEPAPMPKAETFSQVSPISEEQITFPSFLTNDEPSEPHLQPAISTAGPRETTSDIDSGLRAIRDEILAPDPTPLRAVKEEINIPRFNNTQNALRSIREEPSFSTPQPSKTKNVISLEELEKEINASPENNYDEYAYPFGAWLNDKKDN
jgi:hypothetical protein